MSDENLIIDTTSRIFQDLGDPQTLLLAEQQSDPTDWRTPLWSALEEMGLTKTWVSETLNGAGATATDGCEVLRVAGEYAVAVPLAETLIAGWTLGRAGLEVPDGPMTAAPGTPGESVSITDAGKLAGRASAVSFARDVPHIAVLLAERNQVALVATDQCQLTPASSLAEEPRDTVDFTGAAPLAVADLAESGPDVVGIGALARCMQMAGALQRILDVSVQYATERVAFERPIGKFQAVQHNLARLAGEVASANAAANSAAYALEHHTPDRADALFFELAAAKIRIGKAAYEGGMIAHQVHGAIGFTKEHILHRYTHRLWSWRDDFGDENTWATQLGRKVAEDGADALWPTLTSV